MTWKDTIQMQAPTYTFEDKVYKWALGFRFRTYGEQNLKKLTKLARTKEKWEARKAIIREGILATAGLWPLPAKTPLNPVVHGRREYKGYAVENAFFESIPGFFVTGSLYSPVPLPRSVPVVLLPHGHFKLGRCEPDLQHLAATIARMGAYAFAYDMVGYNDSQQVKHDNPRAFQMQLWDSIRALDLVLGLPCADPSRVGASGASGGGTQAFMLAAVDDRVTATAPAVMVSSFFFGGCICESGMPIHKGKGYKTNNAEIAAMTAPRPQILVSTSTDWSRFEPVLEYPFIKKHYDLYGAGDKIEQFHIPGERHKYGPSKRAPVFDFFARHLRLLTDGIEKADGSWDMDGNVIETPEAMSVFTAAHPRPSSALQGDDAVIAAFAALAKK
ncbi:MAG: acetylxylan esterase [Candidatus Lokiarchaeota archaeon]|nr:acetylxylan esterase [Candidatus Lokiarchaeota archaeon]